MNTKNLVASVLKTGIGVAGAAAAQYAGTMVPATTLDPLYTDGLKVVIGGLLIPMFIKGKAGAYAESFGNGFAIQGGLNLLNQYVLKPTGYARMGGVDNADYALYGTDNAGYALMGPPRSQPVAPGSIASYSM